MLIRLDKYLADLGLAPRREARELIRAGRVAVDEAVVLSPDTKLDPLTCRVCLDGSELHYSKLRYFMMNKPAGVLSATEDASCGTVLDLLSPEHRRLGLFPVGRLDKDTEGLLILTNDGDFAHHVMSPKSGVGKLYEMTTDGEPGADDVDTLREGITLKDGTICLPALLSLPSFPGKPTRIEIREGKYHQVKRMMACLGKPVLTLKRLRIGELSLDSGLKPGEYREMSQKEAFLSKSAK